MTGLIWFVAAIHYPLFAKVGAAGFAEYAAAHVRRTGYVVVPPMLLEMATGAWLALAPEGLAAPWLLRANLVGLVLIWLSTFLIQVPCHQRLQAGYDEVVAGRLTATNWIRVVLWSARALALSWAAIAASSAA